MEYKSIIDKISTSKNYIGKTYIEKDDLFNLDNLFMQMKNNSLNIGKQVNNVPYLKEMAVSYENLLNNYYNKEKFNLYNEFISGTEYFEKEIIIQNNYIKLIINIDKLCNKINTGKYVSRDVPTKDLIVFSKDNSLCYEGKERAKTNTKKPILLYCPFVNPSFIIIDGNHRVNYNYSMGKTMMSIYPISINDLSYCYPSTLMEILIGIILNIQVYFNYILGKIPIDVLNNSIIPFVCDKY